MSFIPSHKLRLAYYRYIMRFRIGLGSSIFMGCKFDSHGGFSMGTNSVVNDGCFLDTRGSIYVGNCVVIASGAWIITAKHNVDSPAFDGILSCVKINDYAFLGRRSMVLQGCEIGRGAVLGAGSVLTKSIPDYEIWAGNPAKKIGQRSQTTFHYKCQYMRLFH